MGGAFLGQAIFVSIVATAIGCRATSSSGEQVVRIRAKRFEYLPAEIHVKRAVPVVLELTSEDRVHGFAAPDFGLRTDITPGVTTRLRFVPDHNGRFGFHCDVFCGEGHEDMTGEIIVED